VLLVLKVQLVFKVLQVLQDLFLTLLDHKVRRDQLVLKDQQDLKVFKVSKVFVVLQVLLVLIQT
jgi:hypothetical protein